MQKPDSCIGCDLYNRGLGFTLPDGQGTNGVILVGESAGYEEMRDGLPFRPKAQAGSKLEEALKLAGAPRSGFTIYNVAQCQPPGNRIEGWDNAIEHCKVHFDRVVLGASPARGIGKRVLVGLGSLPSRLLARVDGGFAGVTEQRGFVFPARRDVWKIGDGPDSYPDGVNIWHKEGETDYGLIIPTFHPSFIKRGNPELTPLLAFDIQRAIEVANGSFRSYPLHPAYRDFNIDCFPSLDAAWAFFNKCRSNRNLVIAFDIETPRSATLQEHEREDLEDADIIQIQFAVNEREAIVFPWKHPYLEVITALFALENVKANHFCMTRETSVWMKDGSWKPIWKVKIGELVKTLVDKVIVNRRVTNTFHVVDDRPWTRVTVEGSWNRGVARWGDSGVITTSEHKWILANGAKRKAYDLQVGDKVILPRYGSDSLLLGCLLGDGYITECSNYISIGHTNEGWLRAKAVALNLGVRSKRITADYSNSMFWYCTMGVSPKWRRLIYKDGVKQWIAPDMKALAILYGDDGHINKSGCAHLSIQKFAGQYEQIMQWFELVFGTVSMHEQNWGVVYIWRETSEAFYLAIREYLHPSMDYKLPLEHRRYYNGWMELQHPQIGIVTKVESVEFEAGYRYTRHKYCLEVEDSHTFFTRAGLVSNCWNFDLPRIKAAGVHVAGKCHDTLWMFKHWHPRLPRGLQNVASMAGFPFPWKHYFNEKPQFYGGCDVIAVQMILRWLPPLMKKLGVWEGYQDMVREYYILQGAADRGMPVNDVARMELDKTFRAERREIHKELQKLVPDEIKGIQPRRKQKETGAYDYGYTKEPKKLLERIQAAYDSYVARSGEPISFELYVERLVIKGKVKKDGKFDEFRLRRGKFQVIERETGEVVEVERWYKEMVFKASSQQLIGYLEWKREFILTQG